MGVVKIRIPFLGTLNNRCCTIIGTQKGTIILMVCAFRDHGCKVLEGLGASRCLHAVT